MAVIRLRPRAAADLEETGDYIASDNPAAAAQLISDVVQCCELLAQSPLLGRDRGALRPDIRSFPVGRYIVFYRPVADGIEVIRILHGARDIQSL